jgi:hypothetical protein
MRMVKKSLLLEDEDVEPIETIFKKSPLEDRVRELLGDDYVGIVRERDILRVYSWKKISSSQMKTIQKIWEAWNG